MKYLLLYVMKSAIDNMIYEYISKTNLLNKVTENASVDWGFKNPTSNTTPYAYDDNGSKTEDHYKGIVTVYNHLTLPVYITNGTDSILMLYDAGGSLLRKQHKSGSTVVMTRDYIGGMEYVNDTLDAIYHSEGKIKYIDEVARYEYYIRDHLGNIRLTYSDLNADGLITTPDEILEEMHYYAFGMMMEGSWMGDAGQYGYNGIEYENFLDLEMNLATFRGLDPALGRWWQVDPKAEATFPLTPYGSMNNNPISFTDPDGDIAFLPILIGAGIGAISGGLTNGWEGAWKGALVGAIGGAVPQIGFVSTLGKIGSGAVTGAVTGGLNAGLNNQNILKGAGIGAAIGAGVGLVQDRIQHAKEVKAARRELIASGYDPNGPVPMTNSDLKKFIQANGELNSMYDQSGLPDLHAGTPPPFTKYSVGPYGLFKDQMGNPVAGVTRELGDKIHVHIAPNRFTSALKLYTTVGHELNHAVDLFSGSFFTWSAMGGREFARNVSEIKAHSWSLKVGKQISFETARHRVALEIYRANINANKEWIVILKHLGF